MAHDPVRDEAERLVAAAIAALSLAARGIPRGGARPFATGSEECCVCPICRLIASMRDPNADLAERLATGAGDLASGVASMLRAFNRPSAGGRGSDFPESTGEGDAFWESLRERARTGASSTSSSAEEPSDDSWHAATTAPPPRRPTEKKPMAKKAVKKAAPTPPDAPPPDEPPILPATKKVAKKATKKAAKKAAPKQTAGTEEAAGEL